MKNSISSHLISSSSSSSSFSSHLDPGGDFAVVVAGVVGGGVEDEHAAEDGRPRVEILRRFSDGELQQLPEAILFGLADGTHPGLQVRLGRTEFLGKKSKDQRCVLVIGRKNTPEWRS